ncbi:MAG: hypothetical protein MUP33_07500 [Polaromonas sp.]|nr:hypothetical protein [Polaromonas sp.]
MQYGSFRPKDRLCKTSFTLVFIDNRSGTSGTIGSAMVAKSPADGYTLLIGTCSTHCIGPIINPKIPYDVAHDFEPVAYVAKKRPECWWYRPTCR